MTSEEADRIIRAAARRWLARHTDEFDLREALGGPARATGEHSDEDAGDGATSWCRTCNSMNGGIGGWYPHAVCTYVAPTSSEAPPDGSTGGPPTKP